MSDILTAGICSYGHTVHDVADLIDGPDVYLCGQCFIGSNAERAAVRRPITPPVPYWLDVALIRAEARRLVRKWSHS